MKIVNYKEKTLYFVSTAHVSKASVEEVKSVIDKIQPGAVCIELDEGRARNLTSTKKDTNVDIKTIIKQKKVGSFVASLILSSYQKKIANDLDTQVGQEMKQAIESAREVNARVVYIDRDISITLKRIWNNLGLWRKTELGSTLISSIFSKENVNDADIEELKQSDLLYEAVKEMDEKMPEVSKSILHERNYYMAEKIKRCPETSIVIVIGAAHTEGIIEALDQEHNLEDLKQIPIKKDKSWTQWIVPGIIVLLLIALSFKSPNLGLKQLLVWIVLSSGLSSIGALFVGAHPLTIITTLLGAPVGVLNPFLAVGMFSALAEAYVRPPHISDFDTLTNDASSLKKWFSNKVLRIFLIFIITSLMSSIGTFIAGGTMIKNLFN